MVSLWLVLWLALSGTIHPQEESGSGEDASLRLRFSHRLHLEQVGLTCVDCHQRAVESRRSEDLLFPEEDTCLLCHEREGDSGCAFCHPEQSGPGVLDDLSQPLGGVSFSHQDHLDLDDLSDSIRRNLLSEDYPGGPREVEAKEIDPDLACTACHRGMQRVDIGSRANFPRMWDCLSCHSEDTKDAMRNCETCHPPGFELLPTDHAEGFFDFHSSSEADHDSRRCRQCHTPRFNPCTQCH